MSLTLLIWLFLFFVMTAMAFVRPTFAVAVYMLTFFLSPPFWWWGDAIAGYRWNLASGFILLSAVAISQPPKLKEIDPQIRRVFKVALLIAVNATLVHFLLAEKPEISIGPYVELLKMMLLLYLIFATVKTTGDLRFVIIIIALGGAYIGYEVTINERGKLSSGRLEGIGAPGAASANHFASLMVTILPLVGPLFLAGNLPQRVLAVIAAPFILNVVLMCNSRGAFLAAIASAVVFVVAAPKDIRVKSIKLILAGSLVTFLLAGDPRILERFWSIFVSAEERDSSAQSRIEFAKAGIAVIKDYPLGSGGDGYKRVHGLDYLLKLGIAQENHSLHNGYLNEAVQWGIQGGVLRLAFFYLAMMAVWQSLKRTRSYSPGASFERLAACSFLSGTTALLVTSLFGDHIDSEWGIWLIALMLAYLTLYGNRLRAEAREAELVNEQRMGGQSPPAEGDLQHA